MAQTETQREVFLRLGRGEKMRWVRFLWVLLLLLLNFASDNEGQVEGVRSLWRKVLVLNRDSDL